MLGITLTELSAVPVVRLRRHADVDAEGPEQNDERVQVPMQQNADSQVD